MADTGTIKKKTTRSKTAADTTQDPETSTADVDVKQDQDNPDDSLQELEKQADAGSGDDGADPSADPSADEDGSVPANFIALADGVATITPVNPADIPALARLLLDAADNPAQVQTTTGPDGWKTPESVAKKAGLA